MSETYDTSWSELHEDPLILIARKLQRIDDRLSFRSVCVSWHSASKAGRSRTGQFPLLLQSKVDNGICNTHIFDYGPSEYCKSTNFLRKCDKTRFFLGWKGWVLVVGEHGRTMCLQHAFKKTMTISLPVFPRNINVCKAVLSSDPFMNVFDYTLAIIYSGNGLLLWRPGDKSYTEWIAYGIQDAIFYGGLLCVLKRSKVDIFDVAGNLITSYVINAQRPCDTSYSCRWLIEDRYLVELGGDLVLLCRSYRMNRGEVYQFNFFLVSECSEWKEIHDLGNRAIFIGDNSQSFALDNASEVQGCMPNHIYFTGIGRVATYNLTNATMENVVRTNGETHCSSQTPLWVQPIFY